MMSSVGDDVLLQMSQQTRAVSENAYCPYSEFRVGAVVLCDRDGREADAAAKPFATQYYNLDTHRAALAQPEFLKRVFAK